MGYPRVHGVSLRVVVMGCPVVMGSSLPHALSWSHLEVTIPPDNDVHPCERSRRWLTPQATDRQGLHTLGESPRRQLVGTGRIGADVRRRIPRFHHPPPFLEQGLHTVTYPGNVGAGTVGADWLTIGRGPVGKGVSRNHGGRVAETETPGEVYPPGVCGGAGPLPRACISAPPKTLYVDLPAFARLFTLSVKSLPDCMRHSPTRHRHDV
jgi:hypothetical protein